MGWGGTCDAKPGAVALTLHCRHPDHVCLRVRLLRVSPTPLTPLSPF
jgi:hypothetical protein